MKDIILRLTSRKFLLALSAFLFCAAHGNVAGAVTVVMGYLGVNVADGKITPPTAQ